MSAERQGADGRGAGRGRNHPARDPARERVGRDAYTDGGSEHGPGWSGDRLPNNVSWPHVPIVTAGSAAKVDTTLSCPRLGPSPSPSTSGFGPDGRHHDSVTSGIPITPAAAGATSGVDRGHRPVGVVTLEIGRPGGRRVPAAVAGPPRRFLGFSARRRRPSSGVRHPGRRRARRRVAHPAGSAPMLIRPRRSCCCRRRSPPESRAMRPRSRMWAGWPRAVRSSADEPECGSR